MSVLSGCPVSGRYANPTMRYHKRCFRLGSTKTLLRRVPAVKVARPARDQVVMGGSCARYGEPRESRENVAPAQLPNLGSARLFGPAWTTPSRQLRRAAYCRGCGTARKLAFAVASNLDGRHEKSFPDHRFPSLAEGKTKTPCLRISRSTPSVARQFQAPLRKPRTKLRQF